MQVGDLVRVGERSGIVMDKKLVESWDDDGSISHHKTFHVMFFDTKYSGWYYEAEADFEVISESR